MGANVIGAGAGRRSAGADAAPDATTAPPTTMAAPAAQASARFLLKRM